MHGLSLYLKAFAEKFVCLRTIDNFEKTFAICISKNDIRTSRHTVAISTNAERIAKSNFRCFYFVNFKTSFVPEEKVVIYNRYAFFVNLNIGLVHINTCNGYKNGNKDNGNPNNYDRQYALTYNGSSDGEKEKDNSNKAPT